MLASGDFRLEKPRKGELEALQKSDLQLASPEECDATLIRANPERTSGGQHRLMQRLEARAHERAIHLNPISSFQNYADKWHTFERWQAAGLATPEFMRIPIWAAFPRYAQSLAALAEGGCYLRTSNEDSGKGLMYLPEYHQRKFRQAIRKLRWRALLNKVSVADLLAVKRVDNRVDGLGYIYRVHMVGNTVIGGYALCSEEEIIHSHNLSVVNLDAFLAANEQLLRFLAQPQFANQLVEALLALKIHTAAVEFFIIGGKPIFLEVNPVWGGIHRFGREAFQAALDVREQPANIRLWLNPEGFYHEYWRQIGRLMENGGEFPLQLELCAALT